MPQSLYRSREKGQPILVVGFWCPGVGFSFPLTIFPSHNKAKEDKKGKEGDADSNNGNSDAHRNPLSVVPRRVMVVLEMIYRLSRECARVQLSPVISVLRLKWILKEP
jgi:hypothetical protein